MTDIDLASLRKHAAQFRSAIEACDKLQLPIQSRDFPRGSCGDASILLAKYLENSGFGPFSYVRGMGKDRGHYWLQRDDLVIDISADQFPDIKEPVIVALGSAWHRTFDSEIQYIIADFEIWADSDKYEYRAAYKAILRHLPPTT